MNIFLSKQEVSLYTILLTVLVPKNSNSRSKRDVSGNSHNNLLKTPLIDVAVESDVSGNSHNNSSKTPLIDVEMEAIIITLGCSARRNETWEDDGCFVR